MNKNSSVVGLAVLQRMTKLQDKEHLYSPCPAVASAERVGLSVTALPADTSAERLSVGVRCSADTITFTKSAKPKPYTEVFFGSLTRKLGKPIRPQRLRVSEVEEVSLVDAGANPGANILLMKKDGIASAGPLDKDLQSKEIRLEAYRLCDERLGVSGHRLFQLRSRSAEDAKLQPNKSYSDDALGAAQKQMDDDLEAVSKMTPEEREAYCKLADTEINRQLVLTPEEDHAELITAVIDGAGRGMANALTSIFNNMPEYQQMIHSMSEMMATTTEAIRRMESFEARTTDQSSRLGDAIDGVATEVDTLLDQGAPDKVADDMVTQLVDRRRDSELTQRRQAAEESKLRRALAANQAEMDALQERGEREAEEYAAGAAQRQADGEREAAAQARQRAKEEADRQLQYRMTGQVNRIAELERLTSNREAEEARQRNLGTALEPLKKLSMALLPRPKNSLD